jgi:hypothetical protein
MKKVIVLITVLLMISLCFNIYLLSHPKVMDEKTWQIQRRYQMFELFDALRDANLLKTDIVIAIDGDTQHLIKWVESASEVNREWSKKSVNEGDTLWFFAKKRM